MKREMLEDFFEKYIRHTPYRAIVSDKKMLLCRLTTAVSKGIDVGYHKRGVYITARCVKHMYDKKPAEEFLFLIKNLCDVIKKPERIYRNKDSKRGNFCFIRKVGEWEYLCSIETTTIGVSVEGGLSEELQVATAFRLRDTAYIKNYTLLWDWGNGNPHRSVLDTPERVY